MERLSSRVYYPPMRKILAFLRGAVSVVAGLIVAGFVLMAGRALAFGDGLGVSPSGLGTSTQLIVAATWAVAGGAATWLAIQLSRRPGPGLVTCAWIFTTVWLSPAVRPHEVSMRLVCALAVALTGFAVAFVQRHRMHFPTRLGAPAPSH